MPLKQTNGGLQLGGAIIGPHALGIIQDVEGVRHLAELGVVFLLFNIGLELSLERLRSMQKYVFGMGTSQVGLATFPLLWSLLTSASQSASAVSSQQQCPAGIPQSNSGSELRSNGHDSDIASRPYPGTVHAQKHESNTGACQLAAWMRTGARCLSAKPKA